MSAFFRYTVPEVFVDHQAQKRSGHMGHAMVRDTKGRVLAFYSNCDYDRVHGHSGYGLFIKFSLMKF